MPRSPTAPIDLERLWVDSPRAGVTSTSEVVNRNETASTDVELVFQNLEGLRAWSKLGGATQPMPSDPMGRQGQGFDWSLR